jgi:peptidoglycan L-alanyl-D-glutamate endopeptidase CwlK
MGSIIYRERAAGVDQRLQALMDRWAQELPFSVVVQPGGGCRTQAEQAALYAQGRTAPGPIVTNAPSAAASAHGHSGAIDAMPLGDSGRIEWDTTETLYRVGLMADIAEEMGLEWGGRWEKLFPPHGDYDHFQVPDWKTLPLTG